MIYNNALCCLSFSLVGFFILGAAPVVAAAPTARSEGDGACRPYTDVAVNVMPVFEEAKLNTSVNLAGLQSLSRGNTANTIPHYEAITLGLASYSALMHFYIPIIQHMMPDGSFCARVQHLDARIGYKDVTVYIASEFPQNSCSFQAVLTHEQKHVETNRQVLNEYAPVIRDRLIKYLKLYGMFIVPNQAYADKLLREKVTQVVNEVSKEMMEENRRRQKLIDSPQEYARNNTICNGQISRVVQAHVRRR